MRGAKCHLSACRNAPGMSVTDMYQPSFASIAQDNNIASSDTVGELVSEFVLYSLCDLHLHSPLPLCFLHFFTLGTLITVALFSFSCVTCLLFLWAVVPQVYAVGLVLLVVPHCLFIEFFYALSYVHLSHDYMCVGLLQFNKSWLLTALLHSVSGILFCRHRL